MPTKRVSLVVLAASAVVLAVGIGPGAQARPLAQEHEAAGVTIPYAGRLDDGAGQPVADGAYDLTFALYDEPAGGEPLWSEVQSGVKLVDTLEANAAAILEEWKEPARVFTLQALDAEPGRFADYDVGDTVHAELFVDNPEWYLSADVRVLARVWNPDDETCRLEVEEVS